MPGKQTCRFVYKLLIFLLTIFLSLGCSKSTEEKSVFIFREFLKLYESRIIPLTKEVNLANFEASVTGKNESYKKKERLEIRLNTLYSNKKEFADLKKLKESGAIKEPLLIRQLEILYNTYLANQINEGKLENIIKLQTQIEQHFFVFRTNVAGKYLTDGTHFYDVILFT